MTLTKEKIVDMVRAKFNFDLAVCKDIVEAILEIMKSRLEKGEEVKISSFGKWSVQEKKSRPGRNPHTGKEIMVSARKIVTFHPSEKLRSGLK